MRSTPQESVLSNILHTLSGKLDYFITRLLLSVLWKDLAYQKERIILLQENFYEIGPWMVVRLARDKWSSLFGPADSEKDGKFYNIGPRCQPSERGCSFERQVHDIYLNYINNVS